MSAKLVAFLAPTGAILAFFCSSLTGNSVLNAIGSTLRQDQLIDLPTGHPIGVIGMVLLGIGVTSAALSPRMRSTGRICLSVAAMMTLGFAVILIWVGNWQLMKAFQGLATAEIIDAGSFVRSADKARLPLLCGWGLVVLGAASIFVASIISKRPTRSCGKSLSRRTAVASALLATLFFLLAGVWSLISLRGLEESLATSRIEPVSIARSVSGVINASFLEGIGIACCACTALLMAVASAASDDGRESNQTEKCETE